MGSEHSVIHRVRQLMKREYVAAEVSVAIEPKMELVEISTSVVGLKFSIELRPQVALSVEDRSFHATYVSVWCDGGTTTSAARDRTSDPCKVSSNLENHTVAPRRVFLGPKLACAGECLRCALLV
jgi:hypothetical protein